MEKECIEKIYTKNFINQVKSVFADRTLVQHALESSPSMLEKAMKVAVERDSIKADDVLTLPENKLKAMANKIKQQERLYGDMTTGTCYTKYGRRKYMCPVTYLKFMNMPREKQNIIASEICSVGKFAFSCEEGRWAEDKQDCWNKFENCVKRR